MKRFLVVLCIAALVVGILAAPVGATHRRHKTWRPVYLALGDSVAAGQEADDWATEGYVPLFKEYLRAELDCWPWTDRRDDCRPLLLKNLGRPSIPELELPGVTSALVIEEQLRPAIKIIKRRNYDRWKLNDVKMITLTVGGNDISGPITAACITADPFDLEVCVGAIQASFGEYQQNLTTILRKLRRVAPDTPIIVSTTYNPIVGACPLAADPFATLFADLVLEGGTLDLGPLGEVTLDVGFNDIIAGVAAAYDVTVADVYPAMEVDGFYGDCLHPNTEGHATIADVFIEAFEG